MSEHKPSSPSSATSAASRATAAPERDVHILDRLAVIYRYRHIVISVFLLTSIAIMIQGYSTVAMYQAQGQLLIESERTTAVLGLQAFEQYFEDTETYINTQIKIFKSRDMARRVVRKLHLETYP